MSSRLSDAGNEECFGGKTECGDTPIGKLMHDFSRTVAPEMHYGTLADRVRFFKESKEGIEIMCRTMEDMRNQTLREGMKG